MKLLNTLIVLVIINLSFSAFADWSSPDAMLDYTDSGVGCVDCLDSDEYAPIENWGVWADVGCTEESRIAGSEFDKLCSDFESTHEGE